MIHELRRKRQALDDAQIKSILREQTYGVLAVSSNDEPYAVPLNYVYVDSSTASSDELPNEAASESPKDDSSMSEWSKGNPKSLGSIYFHCAKAGHKLEMLKANPTASFCVVAEHEVLPDEFATAYRSVIAFGPISILDGEDAHDELYALADRFNPDAHDAIEREIASDGPHCLVLKMDIRHITGKKALSMMGS